MALFNRQKRELCPKSTSSTVDETFGQCGEVVELESICSFVNLQSLALCGQHTVDTDMVYEITRKCKLLEEFYLRHCVNIDNATVGFVGRNCSKIRVLDVSFCRMIDDAGIDDFIEERVRKYSSSDDLTSVIIKAEEVSMPDGWAPPTWLELLFVTFY